MGGVSGGVILLPFLFDVDVDDLSESDLESFLSLLRVRGGLPSLPYFEVEFDFVGPPLGYSSKSSVEVAMARERDMAAPSTESTDCERIRLDEVGAEKDHKEI